MTFAAPGFIAAAFAVAAAVVALHLLVLRPPPASRLPTARFVPPAPSMVRRRETWPQDRWLLALRVATILLAGFAFAGPALSAHRSRGTRIIAVDLSAPSARDSAAHYRRPSDVLIGFDTAGAPGRARSLSAALVAARRTADTLRADSIELVIVSPFLVASRDAATAAIRAQWPAAIRVVRATPAPPAFPARVTWVPPSGTLDTVGSVLMDGMVAVAPFTRSRTYRAPEGAVVAWWVDGAPAAVERAVAGGCDRAVAIGMPETREAQVLRAALMEWPCGGAAPSKAMSDSVLRAFAGSGGYGATFGVDRGGDRTLMRVLLVLAGALAIAEWLVRR